MSANLATKADRQKENYQRRWTHFLKNRGLDEEKLQPDERRRLEARFRLFHGGYEIVSRAAPRLAAPPGMTADDDDLDADADDDDEGDADDDQVRRLDRPRDDDGSDAFEAWIRESGSDPDQLSDDAKTHLRVFFQQRATPPGV